MKQYTYVIFCLFVTLGWAQVTVTGTVKDADGSPLPGVNISEVGTSNGTITDFDGQYKISVGEDARLEFSFVGYNSTTITVGRQTQIDVTLESGVSLNDVVVVGSRAPIRSNTTVALPIDVLSADAIVNTGQPTFDKALQYTVPSFNTVQTPVNDATSLLDPYEIRNMGPSRTLILVNGKRKNLSALLYTQTSPGRGETGADISGIPTDAIKRVEVLRDGASAQYGSDAIAGVMNIILKDNASFGRATLRTGITAEGDGETIGFSINNGSSLGVDKGFINYTVDLSKVNLANRPGQVDAEGEFGDFVFTSPTDDTGADLPNANAIRQANAEGRQFVDAFLASNPDANNINGSPETAAAKFAVNGGYDLSENTSIYANAAYVYKKVNSFANYRTPYWRRSREFFPGEIAGVDYFPYLNQFFPDGPSGEYVGYLPTFEGDLNDYNGTLGFRSRKDDWTIDVSYTTGGNSQGYSVNNSHNRNAVFTPELVDSNGNGIFDEGDSFEPRELYRENSPIAFDPGGTRFSHHVGNIDVTNSITDWLAIAFGAEFRSETFEIIEGDLASYDGGGADSFAGNRPENSGKFNRYNLGGYADIALDITPDLLLNGTARVENYSDFGDTFVWKVSGRYKFLEDQFTIRASASTGFRAPTLHQIFTQRAQFSFQPGQGIQEEGLINNVSPQARLLGIPQLDAEESFNFTAGLGFKPNSKFSMTVDYYNIAVEDRIVLGTEIGPTEAGNTPLDAILSANNFSAVSFFVNAIDTRTSGIDVVANYRNIPLGNGRLGFNLSGNYTIQNEREGEVNNPAIVAAAGQSVVNATQEALFFTSRPRTKWILGVNYDIDKFGFTLNNTYFGKTTFRQDGLDTNLSTEFIPKIVTDLGINYQATEKFSILLNVNNILNVLPEWEFKALTPEGEQILNDPAQTKAQFNLITFNGRYEQMTYDGYHFSQLGTLFNLSLNYRL